MDNTTPIICSECGDATPLRKDGKITCRNCGFVIEDRQDFQNVIEMKEPHHEYVSDLFLDKNLLTQIGYQNAKKELTPAQRQMMFRLRRQQKKESLWGYSKNVGKRFFDLKQLCSQLGVSRLVKKEAVLIFKRAAKTKKKFLDSVIPACVFIAARIHRQPRTLHELAEETNVRTKSIFHTVRRLQKELKIKIPPDSPTDFLPRLLEKLGVDGKTACLSRKILSRVSEKNTSGWKKRAIAAASVYLASTENGKKLTQWGVADTAGVTRTTILNHCDRIRELVDIHELRGAMSRFGKQG